LKIDGIAGESQDSKHSNEIQLLSFTFGSMQPSSVGQGGGLGTGRVQVQDLSFTKYVDAATPLLYQFCWNGKHIPKAVLNVRKAGASPLDYFTITISDLIVSSVTSTGNSDGTTNLPTESASLSFTTVEVVYQTQKKDGSLSGSTQSGYNISTGVTS